MAFYIIFIFSFPPDPGFVGLWFRMLMVRSDGIDKEHLYWVWFYR